jgi:hypothetical protein
VKKSCMHPSSPISTERNSATLRDKISQFLLGKS